MIQLDWGLPWADCHWLPSDIRGAARPLSEPEREKQFEGSDIFTLNFWNSELWTNRAFLSRRCYSKLNAWFRLRPVGYPTEVSGSHRMEGLNPTVSYHIILYYMILYYAISYIVVNIVCRSSTSEPETGAFWSSAPDPADLERAW